MSHVFDIFPINGLNRSLHVPVFVGLLWTTYFTEALGWTYAGLVVPGYFAAVMVAAPATAVLIAVESLLTYTLGVAIGKWLPRTQAWSTVFGRERFFLLVVASLAVRLAVEGNLLPWLSQRYTLPHDRELHSVGLVLVPLLANMFWNAGLLRALPRVALLTGLTYAVVDLVLLRHTNFTVSRFEVANESVSLSFLEAPHAQCILVVGALLAARANVLYGWDYNGILVPALLSVAWYQPTKLVTTIVEALVIYGASLRLSKTPLFASALIVGTRRVLMTFSVGLGLKWILGFVVQRFWPGVQMVDYLGFGYLLPSLLAVKMWNRGTIGPILVPTVQVSVMAFALGNAIGYGFSRWELAEGQAPSAFQVTHSEQPAGAALMLADTAPSPSSDTRRLLPAQHAAREIIAQLLTNRASKLVRPSAPSDALRVRHHGKHGQGFVSIAPAVTRPDRDLAAPRVAIRERASERAPWLVVARTRGVGSPTPVLAEALARELNARGFALIQSGPAFRAADQRFVERIIEQLSVEHVLLLDVAEQDALSAVGFVPPGLHVQRVSELLGTPLALRFSRLHAREGPLGNATRLTLRAARARAAAASCLGAPLLDQLVGVEGALLHERLHSLTQVAPGAFRAPSIEELRLFRGVVAPTFSGLSADAMPEAWPMAIAAQLGYRFLRVSDEAGAPRAWLLYEPVGDARRGNATWLRRADASPVDKLLVEIPAAGWEAGTLRAAQALSFGLHADGILLAGALPTASADGAADMRRATGRRSFYQLIHESWVDHAGKAVIVRGALEEQGAPAEAILSTGSEADNLDRLPEWMRGVFQLLVHGRLAPKLFDGSPALMAFDGSSDPALAYAKRFTRDSSVLLWLSPALRQRFLSAQEDQVTLSRARGIVGSVPALDVETCVRHHLACRGRGESPDCADLRSASVCSPRPLAEALLRYTRTRNPYLLHEALEDAPCRPEVVRDPGSGLVWGVTPGAREVCLVPLLGRPAQVVSGAPSSLRAQLAFGLGGACLGEAP